MQFKVNSPDKLISDQSWFYILALLWSSCIWYIGYGFGQKDFYGFLPFYTISFACWIGLSRYVWSERSIFIFSAVIRLGLLFAFPALSDDIYRFYWDGSLTLSGVSPYGILPTDALNMNITNLDQTLYDNLNSPAYYTIYPPINQFYFAISALSGNIFTASVIMKILFIMTEMVGLYFLLKILKQWQIKASNAVLYMLNPLVIIEGTGNLHFEVIMISFLCISIYYIFNNKIIRGAAWMAVSIGIKLLPLMLLPYFLFRINGKDRIKFFGVLGVSLVIILVPVFSGIQMASFLNSIDLYFRKFEFNGSIYYVLRYLGQQMSGYNLIHYFGPLLGITTVVFNIYIAFKTKGLHAISFFQYALFAWTIYLLFATTVHPWYVVSILFFGIFTDWRYPIIWSYLILISYVNYNYAAYYENLWWIALEYILLFAWMVWEIKTKWRSSLEHSNS